MNEIIVCPYEDKYWDDLIRIHDSARPIELSLAGLSAAFVPLVEAAENEGLFDYKVDVAIKNDEVVGFCAYSQEELAWIYVAPDHHKEGVGQHLIAHALKMAPSISSVELLVGNAPAMRLYEKMGFTFKEKLTGEMVGNEAFTVTVCIMEREPSA